MESIWQTIQLAVWNVFHRIGFADVVDIIIVTVILYELIMLMRQTRGSSVIKGLIFLLIACGISNLLGLTALNWMLMGVLNNGVLVLFVLFQPEIRKALEQIGRGRLLERHHRDPASERDIIISELIQCTMDLSRRRVGMLIVFEGKTGLQDVIETGTAIDGRISAPLLENIFEPNTPLHDGAVIIRGERVVAGACILPLTESQGVNRELGTRHRAAIGISEAADATALIVSEETGIISAAREGRLTRHMDQQSLRTLLEELFREPENGLRALFRLRGKEAAQ